MHHFVAKFLTNIVKDPIQIFKIIYCLVIMLLTILMNLGWKVCLCGNLIEKRPINVHKQFISQVQPVKYNYIQDGFILRQPS